MKRQGNLWDQLVSLENIELAHKEASKNKKHYRQVRWVDANKEVAFRWIQNMLIHGRYKTSPYTEEIGMKGNKIRTIHKLPYFPDRIVQHALVNVCKDKWIKSMIRDSFQSIPRRGTLDCFRRVRKHIKEHKPKYAMKIDITKFYPSFSSKYLVETNVFKIKCRKTKELGDEILLSLPFLPLGNHTSQYAGNLGLTKLDWYIKQVLSVKGYYRYCDDLVLFSDSRKDLSKWYKSIEKELTKLGLKVKPKEVYNLEEDYLSFVGYRFSLNKVLLRRGIAVRLREAVKRQAKDALSSYYGWAKHCNATNLYFTTMRKEEWKQYQESNYQSFKLAA